MEVNEDKTEETLIKRCKEKNMKNGGMLSLGSLKEAWICHMQHSQTSGRFGLKKTDT